MLPFINKRITPVPADVLAFKWVLSLQLEQDDIRSYNPLFNFFYINNFKDAHLFLSYTSDLANNCKHDMSTIFTDGANMFNSGNILQNYKTYQTKSWMWFRCGLN